jgi:SPP1 family predicted phage head-tail adaptor
MNPGLLDRRLCLLQRTVTADGAGSPVETWSDAGIMWGQRVEVRGNEAQASGANRSTVAASYRVRYRSDLAAAEASGKFRVRTEGRDYDILSALEDTSQPRRSYMLLSLSCVQGEPTLTSVPVIE